MRLPKMLGERLRIRGACELRGGNQNELERVLRGVCRDRRRLPTVVGERACRQQRQEERAKRSISCPAQQYLRVRNRHPIEERPIVLRPTSQLLDVAVPD